MFHTRTGPSGKNCATLLYEYDVFFISFALHLHAVIFFTFVTFIWTRTYCQAEGTYTLICVYVCMFFLSFSSSHFIFRRFLLFVELRSICTAHGNPSAYLCTQSCKQNLLLLNWISLKRDKCEPENVIWNLQLVDKNRSYEFMHEIYIKLIGIPFHRVENRLGTNKHKFSKTLWQKRVSLSRKTRNKLVNEPKGSEEKVGWARQQQQQQTAKHNRTSERRKYGKIQIKLPRNAGYAGFVCFLSLQWKHEKFICFANTMWSAIIS